MKLNSFLPMILGACAVAATLLAPSTTRGEPDPKSIAALLQDVQNQQKTITENHAKIDEKLAAVAESLRMAKIYVNRAGRNGLAK